jgi:hypothetical protein
MITIRQLCFFATAVLCANALSGCTIINPDLEPPSYSTTQLGKAKAHPQLARGFLHTTQNHWGHCQDVWGTDYRECQTGTLLRSVGPAPLYADTIKLGKTMHQPAIPLGAVIGGTTLGAAASMGSAGGGVGGIVLGVLEILGSGNQAQKIPGTDNFKFHNTLYAVRYVDPKDAGIKQQFIHAVHFAVTASTKMGGSLSGTYGYLYRGTTWAPGNFLWDNGNRDYGLSFVKHGQNAKNGTEPLISPEVVWKNNLNPMVKKLALTVQWQWNNNLSYATRKAELQLLSRSYPAWRFISYFSGRKPLAVICEDANCTVLKF